MGALLNGIYLAWLTAFGVGWGGGQISLIKLLWIWKGIFVLFIFATIAFIGLIKPRKIGVIFGYPIPIAMSIYTGILMIDSIINDPKSHSSVDFSDVFGIIIGAIIIFGIPIFFVLGLNKIIVRYFKFKTIDYVIIVSLTITLLLSWYFMFKI